MKTNDIYPVYLSIVQAALNAPYLVADLETKGLDSRASQSLEIAALKVKASGVVTSSFARLVRTSTAVPAVITK